MFITILSACFSDYGVAPAVSKGEENEAPAVTALDVSYPPSEFLEGCSAIDSYFCPDDTVADERAPSCVSYVDSQNELMANAISATLPDGYTEEDIVSGDIELTIALSLHQNDSQLDDRYENYRGVDVLAAFGDHRSDLNAKPAGHSHENPVPHLECLARFYSDSYVTDGINPNFWIHQSFHEAYNGGADYLDTDGLAHIDLDTQENDYHSDHVWIAEEDFYIEDGYDIEDSVYLGSQAAENLFDSARLFFGVTTSEYFDETKVLYYDGSSWFVVGE